MSTALRVAIVGAGPSGLYAAVELLKRDATVEVELYDRLPTIGGLVRSGVSPDHAARRAVSGVYEQLAVASGRFRFHGNVTIGRDLTHAELLAHHHAVIYASGASADRRLGIPGEDLPGSHAATEFVGWYNAHPDYADRVFDLSHERAVVVGNGNVALDVARMLLLPIDELRKTDIAEHALQALAQSRVREVVILGRRGPAQAAFTAPELLELGAMHEVDVLIENADDDQAFTSPEHPLRTQLLREYRERGARGAAKRLVLRFLSSPTEILGSDRVEGVRVVRNELVRDSRGVLSAQATTQTETITAGLVLRAVGYRALPLPGLPFDETRGVLPNDNGRVLDPASAQALPGCYVAGWLKRGPSGVIGSNKLCSAATVVALLDDARSGKLATPASRDALDEMLARRQLLIVDYRGWKAIERRERSRGEAQHRARARIPHLDELLQVAVAR